MLAGPPPPPNDRVALSQAGARFLTLSNRLLPRPALPGEADPLAYARWEFDSSGPLLELWDRAGGRPARRVLDLGCGLGGKTHRLHDHCGGEVRFVGLDIAEDHLRKAGRYHREVGLSGVARVAGDAAALPFADASFDRIATADTLEHLPAPRRSLAEMRRCLPPDGRLVMLFNPWGSPRGSHLGDRVHLPWAHLLFGRDSMAEATRLEGERRARLAPDPATAAREREFAASLVEHFLEHVHPVRIADFRRWVRKDGHFALEDELHVGPGPLRHWRGPALPGLEELLSASYGAVLRPL